MRTLLIPHQSTPTARGFSHSVHVALTTVLHHLDSGTLYIAGVAALRPVDRVFQAGVIAAQSIIDNTEVFDA